jgi:cysteine desulfurase
MADDRVYLDHAATTPLDSRVLKSMLPYFAEIFGNPSSVHRWGQEAEAAVENARRTVADSLACSPAEVIFTSCGSESDNLALRGVAWAERERRGANHLLTTPVEHDAVLRTAQALARGDGFDLELLPVDEAGLVDPADLARRIRPTTALVSIIYANNEIGSINPIPELGRLCHESGVSFHTDAVQAASQLPLRVDDLGVDLMSIGAHKFYGPKGVGALYVRQSTAILPIQTGGAHEGGLRAGTHNVPLIVGLAQALRLTTQEREAHNARFRTLRDRVIAGVLERVPRSRLTGHPDRRLPNHASFVFEGIDGNELLTGLDMAGYGCSSGSACKTGNPEPSGVMQAIGLPRAWALGSLRVTVGRSTTAEQVDGFLEVLPGLVERLRAAEEHSS